MLGRAMGFIGGIFISLLPPRYRSHFVSKEAHEIVQPAWVSGLLQVVISIFFLVAEFIGTFSDLGVRDRNIGAEAFNGNLGGTGMPGSGIFAFASFALTPAHLFALYIMAEGFVRTFSAAFSAHPIGTLPLYFISGVHNWLEPRIQEKRLGKRVPDEVCPGDGETYELKILSCRPKPDWHRHITIRYRDEFYQMFREEAGSGPRPFIFYLRKPPLGHLIVVIRDYVPTDVLLRK